MEYSLFGLFSTQTSGSLLSSPMDSVPLYSVGDMTNSRLRVNFTWNCSPQGIPSVMEATVMKRVQVSGL